MKTERETEKSELAQWQKISGITAENEKTLGADERDAGIRKLLAEVERRAREEFARGAKVPAGERTVFWDPLERICAQLEISRVKLSAFSRELTGLRAHEITDRIKAANLHEAVNAWLSKLLAPTLTAFRKNLDRGPRDKNEAVKIGRELWSVVKGATCGVARARWAMELGFANPSRLSRACLIAQGMSIQEMMARELADIVQKFLDEQTEDQSQRTRDDKFQEPRSKHQGNGEKSPADEVIQDAVDAVMRLKRGA